MRIILAVILATLVGCAATVPNTQYTELLKQYNTCFLTVQHREEKIQELETQVRECEQGTEEEKKELENFSKALQITVLDFTTFLVNKVGEGVEVKADQIVFIDDYEGAMVRVWVRLPQMLVKNYFLFARDQDDNWGYKGYYEAGMVPLLGEKVDEKL